MTQLEKTNLPRVLYSRSNQKGAGNGSIVFNFQKPAAGFGVFLDVFFGLLWEC